jgi:PKD repeat protein
LTATFTSDPASCGQNDGSVSIEAAGGLTPYSYIWNNMATSNTTFSGLAGGSYTMTLQDANGCASTLNYSISEIPVEASFITNIEEGFTPLEVEFINTSSGANSYVWDFGDGSTPVVTTSTDPVYHIYTEEGNFNAVLYAKYCFAQCRWRQ